MTRDKQAQRDLGKETTQSVCHQSSIDSDCKFAAKTSASSESSGELANALESLKCIEDDLEEGDIPPSTELISGVEGLIRRLYEKTDVKIEIEAMPEGDIVLDISRTRTELIFLHCDADGSAYCATKFRGERATKNYKSIDQIPDEFFLHTLHRLAVLAE